MATVHAHITGTIWSIEMSIGDQVAEGDVVAILESMKMEMPVESEVTGEQGQSVQEGQPLVRVLEA
jgi:acetyl-CoA carboxylase biotin carboxyl carrier protein